MRCGGMEWDEVGCVGLGWGGVAWRGVPCRAVAWRGVGVGWGEVRCGGARRDCCREFERLRLSFGPSCVGFLGGKGGGRRSGRSEYLM